MSRPSPSLAGKALAASLALCASCGAALAADGEDPCGGDSQAEIFAYLGEVQKMPPEQVRSALEDSPGSEGAALKPYQRQILKDKSSGKRISGPKCAAPAKKAPPAKGAKDAAQNQVAAKPPPDWFQKKGKSPLRDSLNQAQAGVILRFGPAAESSGQPAVEIAAGPVEPAEREDDRR